MKLNAEEIYFFTSKVIFKVESAFSSGRIATNENMDVINMTIWKQTALDSYRKVSKNWKWK